MNLINIKRARGFALIYVIIILIPVMTLALVLLELSNTDFKTSSNIIASQQALYNAEAGIGHGIKKLQERHFDGGYDGYNLNKNYSYDEEGSYSSTSLSYTSATNTFNIKSTGFYGGFNRSKSLEVDKYSIMNLRRKFSARDMTASNGRVNFKTYNSTVYVKLQNYEQILVLNEKGVNPSSNIYTFFNGEDVSRALQNTGRYLFQEDSSRVSKISKISTPSLYRKEWKAYGAGVRYYISDKGENINLNLENINKESNGFIKEFKDLGGIINEDGKHSSLCARVVMVDGNVNISGIKGEFSPGVTNAERYFNNLVVYCTGKAVIDDCELFRNGENSDLNLSIMAGEIEFVSSPEGTGSIISHLKGNEGFIRDYENDIAELIQVNTDGEFVCATGY